MFFQRYDHKCTDTFFMNHSVHFASAMPHEKCNKK